MKIKMSVLLAGAAGSLFTAPVGAVYSGLQVVGTPFVADGAPRMMYRVFATFTDPNDYLTAVYGSPSGSALTIQSRNSNDKGTGSAFFNPVISHGSAPTPEVFGGVDGGGNPIPPIPDAAYDTFYTIGVFAGGTGFSGPDVTVDQNIPDNFITGTSFSSNTAAWFTPGAWEQGRAGWDGDGDLLLRVLMMQLTVNLGDNVRGTMNISGINNTGLAGGSNFSLTGQTFNSIPGPGGIAILFAGALVGYAPRQRRFTIE